MHSNEVWQQYYLNGEPIVGKGWEASKDNPEKSGGDEIVGVAIVFLYRRGANGLEFLWQRRSEKIDRYPGDFDFSAGGHINLGESIVEAAVREAKEEIGAKIEVEELRFMTMRPFNKNRFAWIFCVDYTGKTEEFSFDDEEVSEVRWVPYAEMDDFRKKYAKKPLREERVTFRILDEWLRMHGDI